jgi:hypothetical protein
VTDPGGAAAWERTVLLSTGTKLGGCAIGDLDPERPGDEIAVVAGNGEVWIASRAGDRWTGSAVARVGGEMIQCAIGDADLESPGLELVVVGMREGSEDSGGPGRAHLIRAVPGGWAVERIFDDASLLHAVCIANGAVFVAGFSGRAFRLVRSPNGWRADPIAELPGAAKAAAVVGDGVAFACNDGSLVHVARDGAGFTSRVVDKRRAGRARLASDGRRLLVADDDGQLSLLAPGVDAERVYKSREKLRGAVLADLDPAVEGAELATAGYDRQVVLLRHVGDGFQSLVLAQEPDRLHHLACGELDPAPGLELVAVGFGGDLVMFRRRH